jgi:hypothetical protein
MKNFLGDESLVGEQPDPDIDEAQKLAGTQEEDQDDDPNTSEAEKARNWKLSGLSPEDFEESPLDIDL